MPLKTINFPSGELGCVWLHYFSFPTALAFQNVLPHSYAHPVLLSSSFMHNNTVHSETDIYKAQTGLDWQCHKESRLSHKQESHTDDTCGHYSIFAWLVVIFYRDAIGRFFISCEVHFRRIFLGHVKRQSVLDSTAQFG